MAATYSAKARKAMAARGTALPDGSYPIPDRAALRDAVAAFGRAKDPAGVKAHITKRARALGATDLLPADWAGSTRVAESIADLSWEEIQDRVADAVCAACPADPRQHPSMQPGMDAPAYDGDNPACDCCAEVEATYADRVVYERGERYFQATYSLDGSGAVALGEPVEVTASYVPVAESRPAPRGADPAEAGAPLELCDSRFLEAADSTGRVWDVLLIKAGTSGNRKHYPADVLREAVPLFEGARAYADHPTRTELQQRPERSIRDIVGWFDGVRYDGQHGGLRGRFHVLESAEWLRLSLKGAWDAGKRDLLGFSIHATGRTSGKEREGGLLIEAIERVISTDVVTTPGAGGRLLGVLESVHEKEHHEMNPEELKAFRESLLADVKATVAATLTEAAAAPPAEAEAAKAETPPPAAPDDLEARIERLQESERKTAELLARMETAERKAAVRLKVAEAKLPPVHAETLTARLVEALDRRPVEDAEVDAGIAEMRHLIAESAPARVAWEGGAVSAGDDFRDKFAKGVDGFFRNQDVDGVPRFRNLHQMDMRYRMGMGDRTYDPTRVNGMALFESLAGKTHYWHVGTEALLESLTTSSWGEVFADKLYKNMLREYSTPGKYSAWRLLVSEIEPVQSFQTRHWMRVGGYGDLSTVSEQGTYPSATSPGDEEITYAIQKRGIIEDLTFEMLQDPAAANKIRAIPTKLARAAQRTLYKFVFNTLLSANPTLDYDSTALFHANHTNTDAAALSVGAIQTGRQKMRDQAAYGETSEILGELNQPKYLLVPNELEGIANRICNSDHPALQMSVTSSQDTSQLLDPNMFRGKLTPIVVDVWTDANDWMLVADPTQVNTIVMGFLNGNEEPEMFVQDNPTVGAAFDSDKIRYKLRAIWGGDVAEHRSFYLGSQ